MGIVVPFPCGIPCFCGGLFSSEETRWRIFPVFFVFDIDPQKVALVPPDQAEVVNPQAELVPTQVMMKAVCMAAPTISNHAVCQYARTLGEEGDKEVDSASSDDGARLAEARERAMADVAAMLRALREELAEQE